MLLATFFPHLIPKESWFILFIWRNSCQCVVILSQQWTDSTRDLALLALAEFLTGWFWIQVFDGIGTHLWQVRWTGLKLSLSSNSRDVTLTCKKKSSCRGQNYSCPTAFYGVTKLVVLSLHISGGENLQMLRGLGLQGRDLSQLWHRPESLLVYHWILILHNHWTLPVGVSSLH